MDELNRSGRKGKDLSSVFMFATSCCNTRFVLICAFVLLTGVQDTKSSNFNDAISCPRREECNDVVKVAKPEGNINGYVGLIWRNATGCVTWLIQNVTAGDAITLRFENVNFVADTGGCSSGYLCIGPQPSAVFCKKPTSDPLIYTSQQNHMWLTLVTKGEQTNPFNLSYKIDCGKGKFRCKLKSSSIVQCISNHHSQRCDGNIDCEDGQDENGCSHCDDTYKEGPYGYITTPNFPQVYPNNQHCIWYIYVKYGHQIQIRFISFRLENDVETDYLKIYNGASAKKSKLIGTYIGTHVPKMVETSGSSAMLVFHSDKNVAELGFKISYQQKGYCMENQLSCNWNEADCYEESQRCDGKWDCALHGGDERGCDSCDPEYFSCGKDSGHCFSEQDRCSGMSLCISYKDELDCNAVLCGSHNGTYLCKNRKCIYEKWECDGTDDCGDNSDEEHCAASSSIRVITAAVIGVLICAMLLVIALGCSCKLYSLRQQENSPSHCYDSPLTRLQQEFFVHRQAPPPYNEAITTSRSFEDAQREFMEQIIIAAGQRNRQHRRASRPPPNRPQHSTAVTASSNQEEDNTQGGNRDHGSHVTATLPNSLVIGQRHQDQPLLPLPAIRHSDSTSSGEEDDTTLDNVSSDVNFSLTADMTALWRRTSEGQRENGGDMHMELVAQNENADDVTSVDTASGSIDSTVLPLTTESLNKTEDSDDSKDNENQKDNNVVPKTKVLGTLTCSLLHGHQEGLGSDTPFEDSELLGGMDPGVYNPCSGVDSIINRRDDVPLLSP